MQAFFTVDRVLKPQLQPQMRRLCTKKKHFASNKTPTGCSFWPVGFPALWYAKTDRYFLHTWLVIFSASFWSLFSKARTNQHQRRKKFSYLNQLCSFICAYFAHSTLLLSRKRQKAKLAPIRGKCKSSHGRALKMLYKYMIFRIKNIKHIA